MVCLAPRAPGDSVRPRRLSGVVVRPLNFTVRGRFMTPQLKLLATAVCSFLAGAVIVGAVAFVGFNRHLKNEFVSSFYAHAVEAQYDVRALSRLRTGDTQKVLNDLELQLNSHTMQLAEYETVVSPTQRDPYIYRTLAEVRVYRAEFPAHFEYPLQQAEFQKALDLGKKAGG